MSWLHYPGVLKILHGCREITRSKDKNLNKDQELKDRLTRILEELANNVRGLMTSQVGPVVVSMLLSSLLSVRGKHDWPELDEVFKDLVEGNEFSNPKKKGILTATDRLIISKDTWPKPRRYTLSDVFNGDVKHWMSEADEYFAIKASAEVE